MDETPAPGGIPAGRAKRAPATDEPEPRRVILTSPPYGDPSRPYIGMTLIEALQFLGMTNPWGTGPGLYALLRFATELGEVLPAKDYAPMTDLVEPIARTRKAPALTDVADEVRLWLSGPVLAHCRHDEMGRVMETLRSIAQNQQRLQEDDCTLAEQVDCRRALLQEIVNAAAYATSKTAPTAFAALGKLI